MTFLLRARRPKSIEEHVDRLVQDNPLQYHPTIRDHLRQVFSGVPEQRVAEIGSVSVRRDKDPHGWAEYHPAEGKKKSFLTVVPQLIAKERKTNRDVRDMEESGWLRKTGLPAIQSSLHHEVGHHLYFQMSSPQRDAMWTELGSHPGFHLPSAGEGDESLGTRFVNNNQSALVNHVGIYGATSEHEGAAELYAQHRGQFPSSLSEIAHRHMTGGQADEDSGAA